MRLRLIILIRWVAVLSILCMAETMFGASVEVHNVKRAAQNFFAKQKNSEYNQNNLPRVNILHVEASQKGDSPYYYIIDNEDDLGWIILSGDDRINPLIAYSLEEKFDLEQNSTFVQWMKDIKQEIDFVLFSNNLNEAENREMAQKASKEWEKLLSGAIAEEEPVDNNGKDYTNGTNLLNGITWNQTGAWSPISSTIPAGCVSTAMGQIIKYWGGKSASIATLRGKGYFNYYDYAHSIKRGVTYYSYTYYVSEMSGTTPSDMIRNFLYGIGVSVQTIYKSSGSGASGWLVPYALHSHFGFNNPTYYNRENYSDTEWISKIRNEIQAERPVYYDGSSTSGGGHAFVISGYNSSNNNFYVNWGWGGSQNGWYTLALTGFYPNDHRAVCNIKPLENDYVPNIEIKNQAIYTIKDGCLQNNVFLPASSGGNTFFSFDIKNNTSQNFQGEYPISYVIASLSQIGTLTQNLTVNIPANSTATYKININDHIAVIQSYGFSKFNLYCGVEVTQEYGNIEYGRYPDLVEQVSSLTCEMSPIRITDVRLVAEEKLSVAYQKPEWTSADEEGAYYFHINGPSYATIDPEQNGTMLFDYNPNWGAYVFVNLKHINNNEVVEAEYAADLLPQIQSFNASLVDNGVNMNWSLYKMGYKHVNDYFQIECYNNSSFSGSPLFTKEVPYAQSTLDFSTTNSLTLPQSKKLYFRIRYKSQGALWGWNYFVKTCSIDFSNNESATFTWNAASNDEKTFSLKATSGTGNILVDWGNGSFNVYNGNGNNSVSPSKTYSSQNDYTVSVHLLAPNAHITYFFLAYEDAKSIDVSKLPALTHLNCSQNIIANTLNVSQNPLLNTLYCNNNLLTNVNTTGASALVTFSCNNNQIASVNISQNTLLATFNCSYNQITSLNFSNNPNLNPVYCYHNYMMPSKLYAISQQISNSEYLNLGTQNQQQRNATAGTPCNLQGEMVLGGVQTAFSITKNGAPAVAGVDYQLNYSNETLTFLSDGEYEASLTNTAIGSNSNYPAKVVIPFHVGAATVYKSASFTWQAAAAVEKKIYFKASQGTANISVNWGDGTAAVYNGNNNTQIAASKTYSQAGDYTVFLNVIEPNTNITYFFLAYEDAKSINVSQLSALTELNCSHNIITNSLDVSQNSQLAILYCNDNLLTNVITAGASALATFYCNNNQITSINVSQNSSLASFQCHFNRLTSLSINNNPNLTHTMCRRNNMMLSKLYATSQQVSNPDFLCLGTQDQSQKSATSGVPYNLQGEMVIGGVQTQFAITKDGQSAIEGTDYQLDYNNETLTFLLGGGYEVNMTNDAIVCHVDYPAKVVIPFAVSVSSNANLESLTVSEGALSPSFNPTTLNYTVNVSNTTSSITITGTAFHPHATVSGNGTFSLNIGENIFNIIVTAEDGTTNKTYQVAVYRLDVASYEIKAYVSGSGGIISPSGNVIVGNGDDQTFTFYADNGYSVKEVLIDGTPNQQAVLDGYYTFKNVVANHSIEISFIGSSASLESLTVSEGVLNPAFNPNTTNYTVNVSNTTSNITITGKALDPNATVDGNGTFPLDIGANLFEITVIAEDGTTSRTYYVEVKRLNVRSYEIEAFVTGIGGAISPQGTVIVAEGEDQTFTFILEDGYGIDMVLIDGAVNQQAIDDGYYTFANVTSNHIIELIINPLSIITLSNKTKIYPNPAQDFINIESEMSIKKVIVYNSIGHKFFERKNIGERLLRIDINHYPTGLYLINIDGKTFKFIKK